MEVVVILYSNFSFVNVVSLSDQVFCRAGAVLLLSFVLTVTSQGARAAANGVSIIWVRDKRIT